jgi:hypothetical protein
MKLVFVDDDDPRPEPDFSGALTHYAEKQRREEPELDKYVSKARDQHHRDGELEIDDPGVIVSKGDDTGAYVSAWVWVED